MNNFKRFQQGDKVMYVGRKFAQKLSGVLGVVDAHVGNSTTGVVVSFGSEAYVMDYAHLTPFQGGKVRELVSEEKPKDVEVTHRNRKRRIVSQDDE